ncbi:hypothetical protein [Botrimarina hoheduenensis]|uniref:DUF4190 domain-containing protein n=1 Tax=Botrimarina hoheduenensis TaxID=2528000 RepID=A0A5C5WCQ9_9BACT|nr:hypothetical protein [Botrimarina hoheduenensis]TWT47452.1 hypothetical protein Pla111_10660 [Botrimarina hoheduenensis]
MSVTHSYEDAQPIEYRSVHTGAIIGLVLALASAVVPLTAGSANLGYTLPLSVLPMVGFAISMVAWRAIAGAPDVYAGGLLAIAGALLSAVFLITGVSYASYVYATEVPDGYERTSFLEMKPSESDLLSSRPVPDPIRMLIEEQKPVFIKGYIRPDSTRFSKNITDFLLVRDSNECCFGDLSKVQFYDQIKVQLAPGLATDLSRKVFRVGGVLRVGPGSAELAAPLLYYLDADYIR